MRLWTFACVLTGLVISVAIIELLLVVNPAKLLPVLGFTMALAALLFMIKARAASQDSTESPDLSETLRSPIPEDCHRVDQGDDLSAGVCLTSGHESGHSKVDELDRLEPATECAEVDGKAKIKETLASSLEQSQGVQQSLPRIVVVGGIDTEPLPSLVDSASPTPLLDGPEPHDRDPLDNKPWLKLVQESVILFDELDHHRADFDAPRQEVADYVICRIQQMLERCGVEVISGNGNFDRNRHKPEGTARVLPGAIVTETLSPGFRVGKRILRRARVQVSNSGTPDTSR